MRHNSYEPFTKQAIHGLKGRLSQADSYGNRVTQPSVIAPLLVALVLPWGLLHQSKCVGMAAELMTLLEWQSISVEQ